MVRRTAADVHPPLFYLILQGWVAVCGDSPAALRSLSVIFGMLTIVLVYALCMELFSAQPKHTKNVLNKAQAASLFAAFVAAIHESQVGSSRSARMYSLGVLLSLLTAWFLLRALRGTRRRELLWSAYGVTIAAFCYTHYYAFFTVLAEFVGCLGVFALQKSAGDRPTRKLSALGFLLSIWIAGLLYAPWVLIFLKQTQAVRQYFWIEPPAGHEVLRVLFTWGTGLEYQGPVPAFLWLGLFALLGALVLWHSGWSGSFVLLPMMLPWISCLCLSFWSDRSIFLDRYLVFAQVFYVVLLGLAFYHLPGVVGPLLLVCWAALPSVWGATLVFYNRPSDRPAVLAAAEFLRDHYRAGDQVRVSSPQALNILRYYADHIGLAHLDVRCPLDPLRQDGHATHVASLTDRDVLWVDNDAPNRPPERMWYACDENAPMMGPPQGMKVSLSRRFQSDSGTHYRLVLFERDS
jgi:4-amino-4-deoxy-L-arabinose transferase-like glycosyltransferase